MSHYATEYIIDLWGFEPLGSHRVFQSHYPAPPALPWGFSALSALPWGFSLPSTLSSCINLTFYSLFRSLGGDKWFLSHSLSTVRSYFDPELDQSLFIGKVVHMYPIWVCFNFCLFVLRKGTWWNNVIMITDVSYYSSHTSCWILLLNYYSFI